MTKKRQLPKTASHGSAKPRQHTAVRRSPQRPPLARLPSRAAAAAAVTGFLTANRIAVRFCLLFPALLLLCSVALQRQEVNRLLTLPFATLIATLAAAILRLLHAGVR